jgi:alkylation response protein AidB-like acyl-CoA dehydrogenase
VTNAPVADLTLVFATVDKAKGMWGVTAFLVERGTPGFRVSRDIEKLGLRTSPMAEVILEDCFLPEAGRLGPEGAGAKIFNSSMEWERSCILASHLGAMERQLEGSSGTPGSANNSVSPSASFNPCPIGSSICASAWRRPASFCTRSPG